MVNVTVEADALCGPLLAHKAALAGVVYSLAFGDQPALICDLVDWARTCGFPVVAAGRGHKWLPHFNQSTPDTVWGNYGLTPEQALRAANSQLYLAINMVLAGNAEMIDNVWSQKPDVSDFGPSGDRIVGWKAVEAQFKKEAAMKMGGTLVCEDLTVTVGADMGYTTCMEVGSNQVIDGKPVNLRFRATNVFRLEKGEWKLVHHHTDPAPAMQAKPATKN